MRIGHWVYTIPLRLRSLFRRARVDAELEEEMRGHLELLIEAQISRGATPREARQAALRAMDGITQRQEECRDARRVGYIEDLIADLQFAVRTLRRNPLFAVVSVSSLALGIGANTLIFSAADAALWKPLPVDRPEQLVRFAVVRPDGGGGGLPATLAEALETRGEIFAGALAESVDGLSFSYDGRAERILAASVTPNYFSVLGVRTVLGTPFSAEVRSGRWAAETVISYRFWQNRFAGDPHVLGRVIRLNTYPFTIVGVSDASFYDLSRGLDPELRIPRLPDGRELAQIQLLSGGGQFNWDVMARVRPGSNLAQASTAADAIFQDILARSSVGDASRGAGSRLRALPGGRGWPEFLEDFSTPLFVVFGLVGGVLLVACGNVANLLLARGVARRRELAIRCSIGASRFRLVRQMLAESLILAGTGGAVGILAAFWCGPLLLHFLPRSNVTLVLDLHPDLRELLFTSALALASGSALALVPAFHATRGDLVGGLRADTAGAIGDPRSARFRKALVAGQVAFSLAVLITAGLLGNVLHHLRPRDLPVDPNRVLQFMMKPQQEIYSDARKWTLFSELIRRVSSLPGVESVGLSQPAVTGRTGEGILVGVPGRQSVRVVPTDATPGILRTFGIHLVAGRDFTVADRPGTPLVALLNRSAARALYGNESAVGRTFQVSGSKPGSAYQVVGVVDDVDFVDLRQPHRPAAFFAFQEDAPYMPVLQVRVGTADAAMFASVRRALDDVDRDFPVFNVKTMALQIDDALARERMAAHLGEAFSGLSLLLASIGLYGVLGYSVSRRAREIAIRMALGATSAAPLSMVAQEALEVVAIGCAGGLLLAIPAARYLAAHVLGVAALDLPTVCAATGVMLVIAITAVSGPALRASRIDPIRELRSE